MIRIMIATLITVILHPHNLYAVYASHSIKSAYPMIAITDGASQSSNSQFAQISIPIMTEKYTVGIMIKKRMIISSFLLSSPADSHRRP